MTKKASAWAASWAPPATAAPEIRPAVWARNRFNSFAGNNIEWSVGPTGTNANMVIRPAVRWDCFCGNTGWGAANMANNGGNYGRMITVPRTGRSSSASTGLRCSKRERALPAGQAILAG